MYPSEWMQPPRVVQYDKHHRVVKVLFGLMPLYREHAGAMPHPGRTLSPLSMFALATMHVMQQFNAMPLEKANEAYRRMKSGDVKFRMILTMASGQS